MAKYIEIREKDNIKKLRRLLDSLPYCCEEFFIGIANQTSILTRVNYAYDLRIFFDFLMKNVPYFKKKTYDDITLQDIAMITTTDIEVFMNYLTYFKFNGREYANSEKAKSRKLSTIRSFFKYFYNKDKLPYDVAAKVNLPKLHEKDIIRLENDEIGEMLAVVETGNGLKNRAKNYHKNTQIRDTAIVTLFLGTGIRISELVGLNNKDIDFKNNSFSITRKGGNQVILYFSDEVKLALLDYMEEKAADKRIPKEEDAMFLSLQKRRISVRAVEILIKKYAAVATPLKKITPHKLRSTYGTNLYRATKDIYVVADVLGHKDVNTTKKHYAAISEDIRKSVANKVILDPDFENK